MTFKVGVVGLGKIAKDQHLPVIDRHPEFELVAVVSSRESHATVPTFRTLTELIASEPAIDALALCMPPRPRFDVAYRALEAGFHLLLERPPTSTVGELEALVACAQANNRALFVSWHSRYNAAVDAAKLMLANKSITRIEVLWKEDVHFWHPGQEWIWEPGGFGVFDPGINALSLVSEIVPMPIVVTDAELTFPANKHTPVSSSIRFALPGMRDAEITAEFDWLKVGEPIWDINVETSDGSSLRLADGGTKLVVDGEVLVTGSSAAEYIGMYDRFALLLGSGKSDVDLTPLRLVADCFTQGRIVRGERLGRDVQ